MQRTHHAPIANWKEMNEQLKEKYLPIDYEQIMLKKILQLRQGSLTIDQYTNHFHELTVRSKIAETINRLWLSIRLDYTVMCAKKC